jgi:hypothetical protein
MITLKDYWRGRDVKYPRDLTPDIRSNATTTVEKVNQLLALAEEEGIVCEVCTSGWRPIAVNDSTSNSVKASKHIKALACDILDTENRDLARWCLRNLNQLEHIGLWMEDPQWTPTWVHLQIVPPGSGRRVYIPSIKPPLAGPLPEQRASA